MVQKWFRDLTFIWEAGKLTMMGYVHDFLSAQRVQINLSRRSRDTNCLYPIPSALCCTLPTLQYTVTRTGMSLKDWHSSDDEVHTTVGLAAACHTNIMFFADRQVARTLLLRMLSRNIHRGIYSKQLLAAKRDEWW